MYRNEDRPQLAYGAFGGEYGYHTPDQADDSAYQARINEMIRRAADEGRLAQPKTRTPGTQIDKERLADLIQSESNSRIYYEMLSFLATEKQHLAFLTNKAGDSEARVNTLGALYHDVAGEYYQPHFFRARMPKGFGEGLRRAIETESEMIRVYSDLLSDARKSDSEELFASILYKRIADLSILNLFQSDL